MVGSICLVRLSALGDVLMCLPAVRRLQDSFPEAKITWIISPLAYDLVKNIPDIEFIVEKPESLGDYWRFYQKMRKRRFDVLLAMQASFRANLLYPLIKAKRKIGYDSLRAKDGHFLFVKETIPAGRDHTLEGFLKFADALNVSSKEIRWDIPLMEEDQQFAKLHTGGKRPLLLVNPAASKAERSWPVDRYIQVLQYAKNHWNCDIIVIGGPGELDRRLADQILAAVDAKDLTGKTKVPQLLALIAQADALLCPDTGPSHMAAAVNTPVVALHAVTSAKVSGPYPFRHLAVDYYDEAVVKILKKDQNSNVWGTHAHGETTMELVPVEPVIKQLEQILHKPLNSKGFT